MEFSPGVKNLLGQSSTFRGDNSFTGISTFKRDALGATTISSAVLANTTAATASASVQVSPSIQWRANGWRTTLGGSSRTVDFRSYVVPSNGTGETLGEWKLQYSLNGAAYSDGLQYFTNYQDGLSIPKFIANGFTRLSANNSSTIDTLQNLDLHNPSGSRVNLTATFASTIRWGIQVQDNGYTYYKAAGSSAQHNFQIGSTIGSVYDIIQIYSGGIYNNGGMFAQGKVTAGAADTSPPAHLNTFGSFAVRGKYVTDPSYTITENETVIYADATNAQTCTGTPTNSCASTGGGESGCNARSAVGCSWYAGNDCSGFNQTSEGDCESGHAGCTYEESSCSAANNTDQSTCEGQDDAYGGSCSWDTSTCSSQTTTAACSAITGCTASENNSCSGFTDTVSCNAQTPCSPVIDGDCTALSDGGGDGTACLAAGGTSECSYDNGTGACTGLYFTSCSGSYFDSCSGNLCGGNYFTGTCSGTWGAFCSGNASCSGLSSSTPCNAEAGCSWSSAQNLTLPVSSLANDGNTSRFYWIKNIGATGTVNVLAGSGDTLQSAIALSTQYSGVLLHHHMITKQCSLYSATNQSTCETGHTGCTWSPAIVCSSYNGDQSACESAGCSYNEGVCSGAGSASSCNGTYTDGKIWFKHSTT